MRLWFEITKIKTAANCDWITGIREHMQPSAAFVPVMSLFFPQSFRLIAVIMWLFSQEVLSYSTHSPVRRDKSVEDVLRNLNLSSTITPQMIHLGLSQERKSSDMTQQSACFQMLSRTRQPCICVPLNFIAFDSCVLTVVDEVWHQQAVLRLLQLIELPLLENLLEAKDTLRPPLHSRDSDPDLLYTSSYLDREVLKAFSEAQ